MAAGTQKEEKEIERVEESRERKKKAEKAECMRKLFMRKKIQISDIISVLINFYRGGVEGGIVVVCFDRLGKVSGKEDSMSDQSIRSAACRVGKPGMDPSIQILD